MKREYYIGLAQRGLRMPIGADLVLHEQPDPEAVMHDGRALGQVLEQTAERYQTPLAIALMDLRLEKADLLGLLGKEASNIDTFHFAEPPSEAEMERVASSVHGPFPRRNQAHIDSVAYIARETRLLPIGIAIGPFSLMTKLMADPISAVAMAGMGLTGEDEPSIRMAERCLRLAEVAVSRAVSAQTAAGAKAVLICEPAANRVYLSPRQVESGADILERFVMQPHLRLKQQLASAGVDLIFHDCGELTDFMVRQFAERLHPVILSFGSSRRLWEDARLVPEDVVLFGNLPTKSFYSDADMPVEKVEALTCDLLARMKASGHPHILGSECDVIHVPEAAEAIRHKVDVMLHCGCQ